MNTTDSCNDSDLRNADHTRCVGAVFDFTQNLWDEGTACECPCHAAERCYDVYIADHGGMVYHCDLHKGHGGSFHSKRLQGGGSVMWGLWG